MTYMKAETIQDKLNTFHKAFGHDTNAKYPASALNATKSLRINLYRKNLQKSCQPYTIRKMKLPY